MTTVSSAAASTQLLGTLDDVELVGTAADGAEAVALCSAEQPDVVLMDLEMPDLDGIEATRRIKAERPDVAVVILTSFSDRERILRALDAGAAGYLLKDAESDELATVDSRRCARRCSARPEGRPRAAERRAPRLPARAGSRRASGRCW